MKNKEIKLSDKVLSKVTVPSVEKIIQINDVNFKFLAKFDFNNDSRNLILINQQNNKKFINKEKVDQEFIDLHRKCENNTQEFLNFLIKNGRFEEIKTNFEYEFIFVVESKFNSKKLKKQYSYTLLEIEEKKIINETNKIEASTVKSINESFELISSTFKNTNVIIDMLYNKFSNDIIQGEFNMTSNEPNNFDISLKEKANNSIIDQNFNEMQSKLLQKILEHNEIEKQFQKIAEIKKKNLNQNIDCEISILKKEIIYLCKQ